MKVISAHSSSFVVRKEFISHARFLLWCLVWLWGIAGGGILGRCEAQDQELLKLFAIIESDNSRQDEIEAAFIGLQKMGLRAIPLIQSRFDTTGNPRYFYLLQKLSPQPSLPDDQKPWDKEHYFRQKYSQAHRLLQRDEVAAAQKIAQAILALEPDLSFRAEILDLVRQCQDAAQTVVTPTLTAERTLYAPGSPIQLTFMLKNLQTTPVHLLPGQSGIVVQAYLQAFYLSGQQQEETIAKLIPFTQELTLAPGQTWKATITIANPIPASRCYGLFQIHAHLPRCQIKYENRSLYPKINFPELKLSSLPSSFFDVVRQPAAIALQALSLRQPEPLFFATFFVDKTCKAELVPALIQTLESDSGMDQLCYAILRRLTGKHFANKNLWANYWQARGDTDVQDTIDKH